jgi:hypothetical protein
MPTQRENEIETHIQARKLLAPRLTPEHIDSVIVGETFTRLPSARVTVCELTLKNGSTVRGESAVVSIENFNEDVGQNISRNNARGDVWKYEAYLLHEKLHAKRSGAKAYGAMWPGDLEVLCRELDRTKDRTIFVITEGGHVHHESESQVFEDLDEVMKAGRVRTGIRYFMILDWEA